jgi:hypothetical protein
MNTLTQNQIETILKESESKKLCSDFGFFSRPYRLEYEGKEFIVKQYLPIKDGSTLSAIIQNHDRYVSVLTSLGINIPETRIISRKIRNKEQLVIIQEPFRDPYLLRNMILSSSLAEIQKVCILLFNDILAFWKGQENKGDIGFHPTIRNYAYHNAKLYFFDTFPPMLMKQSEVNRLIITMSPFGKWIKRILPARMMNIVSDEFYQLDRMFTGIVGSCCRLRPEYATRILEFSTQFVMNCPLLTDAEKERITKKLTVPPQLPWIWILIRKLSKNTGAPNIDYNRYEKKK